MEQLNEKAVWDRVSAAARSAEPEKQQDQGPIGPDLLESMAKERETAQAYRVLAAQAGAEGQRILRRISAQEQQHSQILGALYYFLTGQAPRPRTVQRQTKRERFSEGLRRQMQAEELTAGWYEALAKRTTGEVQNVLMQIAREEQEHFHLLLGLLKSSL